MDPEARKPSQIEPDVFKCIEQALKEAEEAGAGVTVIEAISAEAEIYIVPQDLYTMRRQEFWLAVDDLTKQNPKKYGTFDIATRRWTLPEHLGRTYIQRWFAAVCVRISLARNAIEVFVFNSREQDAEIRKEDMEVIEVPKPEALPLSS